MNKMIGQAEANRTFHAGRGILARCGSVLLLTTIAIAACPVAYSADVTPETYSRSCSPGYDDTACWQAAINAAHPNSPAFGTVAGSSGPGGTGKIYLIKRTLVICNATDGVIDGHGAILRWQGARGQPMFLVINGSHMRFQNLAIQLGGPQYILDSAFEFTSATSNGVDATCTGPVQVSSRNSMEHVSVTGTGLNSLLFGVRFSNRYGVDASNDQSTISDSTFDNITTAAISIEHSQSHQHHLISVSGYGAPGNTGCFVSATTGFFSSVGGFQGGWGKANFCVDGTAGPFDIIDSNSEASGRLLSVGNPGDFTGYAVSVNIMGGRFATNALASDGYVVSFNRLGVLTVRGLRIESNAGVSPAISIQPAQFSGTARAAAIIDGVTNFGPNSASYPTIVAKAFVALTVPQGNVCLDATNVAACQAALRVP